MLTACGSGGGGSNDGVVVVPGSPTASASPTPSATPLTAEQMEDQRSTSALAANAEAAYRVGVTGRGIRIAVLDTGIVPTLSEFAGRIDPASADMAGFRGLADASGHGTAIASIVLAARDGRGMHGLAYDATLLSLNISEQATCKSLTQCPASSSLLIRGIDAAIAAKARVINISANTDQTSDDMIAAVRRAAAAGIVIVISGGNNEAGGQQPLLLSRSFAEAAPGWVIIAGGHDASGGFAQGSVNRAGSGAAASWYLAALVKNVTGTGLDGSLATFADGGTSSSAAAISGAVALVAQARPNLTGAQIVSLLLANATDAGAAGLDPLFGNGILNLATTFAALPPA